MLFSVRNLGVSSRLLIRLSRPQHLPCQSIRPSSNVTGKHRPTVGHQPPQRRRREWPLNLTFFCLGAASYMCYLSYSTNDTSTLNPKTFTPYTVLSRTPISPTSSIFTLHPCTTDSSTSSPFSPSQRPGIWSVQLKQPQLQIARAYTPLPPLLPPSSPSHSPNDGDGDINLLIRREHLGEVSTYLHDLSLGATVEVRGPKQELEFPNDVSDVVFVVGGTGVAPALQAAWRLLHKESYKARIHILWANRRRIECLGGRRERPAESTWKGGPQEGQKASDEKGQKNALVRQLDALREKSAGALTVDYFVDEEGTFITAEHLQRCLGKRASDGKEGRGVVLVVGPEGFVNYVAGANRQKSAVGDGAGVETGRRGSPPFSPHCLFAQVDLTGWQYMECDDSV